MKHGMRRAFAMLLAAVMAVGMVPTAAAAGGAAGYPEDTEHTKAALAQGDDLKDQYTHKDELFTMDMVHNNPALQPYTSNYTNSEFLAQRNFDGHVFFLYDCAQYGLLWDEFDKAKEKTGDKKVFPEGSEDRAWVEAKKASIKKMYQQAVEAKVGVYFMMDIIVLPTHLVKLYPEILTKGKIDITKKETQEVMDYMFKEMFTEYPEIDGIYFRFGETYTGKQYGAPYHSGNNPILNKKVAKNYHMTLIKYLGDKLYGDKMVDEKPRDMIYRTWGFSGFQNDPKEYLSISEEIPTNDHLYFCIKHSTGDFHRTVAFNQTIGIGKHQQIVEVQAAREYEGKGAYPNYIADGVINGFEEYEWQMDSETQKTCLRDVINTQEHPQIKGIWTWSRGGGWNGPYINGVNGIVGDHTSDNQEVVIKDGSEMWNDLNTYVVTQWAKDTSKTDKYYVKEYAKKYLGMDEADAENFYRLCILSSRAVLLGRARDTESYSVDTWWTRDQNINPGKMKNNINKAVGHRDEMLAEKAECTALWQEMIDIASSFKTEAKLIDSPVKVKDYITTTCKYGYYFFAITEQMNIAAMEAKVGGKSEASIKKIAAAVAKYDRLWEEWEELYKTAPGCPSLFAKENRSYSLVGYSGNTGLDGFMDDYRETLSMSGSVLVEKNGTAELPVKYSYTFSPEYFTFESSDSDVAEVNEAGQIVGKSVGKCRITAISPTGLSAAAMVEVIDKLPTQAEYTTLYENDFESNDSNKEFTSNTPALKDGSAVITGTGGTKNRLDYILPLGSHEGKLRFSGDFKITAVENDHFALRDSNNKTLLQVDFRPGDPVFALNDGSQNPQIGTEKYKLNTSYHMVIDLDTETQKFDIIITEEGTGTTFEAKDQKFRESAANLSNIRFGGRGTGSMYVDNLKVEKLTVESSTLFKDNFSADTSAGWTAEKGKTGKATWNEETQDLTISASKDADMYLTLSENYTGTLTASWRMKVNTDKARAFVRLADASGRHLCQVEFRGGTHGNTHIIADINSTLPSLTDGNYSADTWYDVTVDIDFDAKTHTITVAGNKGREFAGFKETKQDVTGLGRIDIGTRNGAAITVDDFKITTKTSSTWTAQDIAATITAVPSVSAGDVALKLPAVPDGYELRVKSSDPAGVVAEDGSITYPENETDVTLVLEVVNQKDSTDSAEISGLKVTVPAAGSIPVSSVSLDVTNVELTVGESKQLTATVLPENAANKNVSWVSDNTEVATVEAGLITAMSAGTANITVTTEDGNKTAACAVAVKAASGSSSVTRYTITVDQTEGGIIDPGTVRVRQNSDQTFKIKADTGYQITDVLVDGKSVGSVSSYTFQKVTAKHTITAVFKKIGGEEGHLPFADVKNGDWYHSAVEYAYENGLMSGTGDKLFTPNGTLSRSMIVQILYSLEGRPEVKVGSAFNDVKSGAWYADAVNWATSVGIVSGYGDGKFGADDSITREQLAMILYQYAKLKGHTATDLNTLDGFSDTDQVSDWALEAIRWAVENGLMSGKNGGKLDPNGTATRAETATILMQFCEKIAK